jgi:hypothetical protein
LPARPRAPPATMASTLSEVAATFLVGATPNVRRAPRSTALTRSSSVGGCEARQLVAVADPGDPAAERRAFDASARLGGDKCSYRGRISGQGAEALLGAPCPEDREIAAIGALCGGRLLSPGEVGRALQRRLQRHWDTALRDRQGLDPHVHGGVGLVARRRLIDSVGTAIASRPEAGYYLALENMPCQYLAPENHHAADRALTRRLSIRAFRPRSWRRSTGGYRNNRRCYLVRKRCVAW